jgi:Flp pilus assembly protein TadG
MSTKTALLLQRLKSLRRDETGVSAVEFALLLPLMLSLYLGAVEISQAISIDRKVTMTSRAVADLASQEASVSSADMSNILNASSAVITPYDPAKLQVTVSGISIDAAGKATIAWSCTLGGTAHAVGSSVTLPAALDVANTALIWGEATYTYTPAVNYVITGTLNLSDQIYMTPRLSNSVSGSC